MEWQIVFGIIFGTLMLTFVSGMPIAFCFLLLNIGGAIIFWGGAEGARHLMVNFASGLASWSMLPIFLFVIMGDVMFHSGLMPRVIDSLDQWIGRIPGRLSLLTVASGTLFATLSGSTLASIALLGSTLARETERRGYKKAMSIGPVLGSGGLAMMIPPSAMAVLIAALAMFSVGKMLIAIIMPGLTMAALQALYIIIRCKLDRSLAPAYEVTPKPLLSRSFDFVRYVLPLGLIVFLVTGVIFAGIATPSEAAATGTFGCFILAAIYGRLNWTMVRKAMTATMRTSGMILLLIMGATSFSAILAFTGVTKGLIGTFTGLSLSPLVIIALMLLVPLILGCFMDVVAVLMITVPIFYPVVHALGMNPIWFGVMLLLTIDVGMLSPPFGMGLFVMKGVAEPGTKIGEIYRAGLPFLSIELLTIILLLFFPMIGLWLPGLMRPVAV